MSKRDVRQIANIPLPAHDYSGAVERLFADMTDEDWLVHAEIHRMMIDYGPIWRTLSWMDLWSACFTQHGADPTGRGGRWTRSADGCFDSNCHHEEDNKDPIYGLNGVYGDHFHEIAPDHLSFEAIEQNHIG